MKFEIKIAQEAALAMAQATISNAISTSTTSRSDISRNLNIPVNRLLSGEHDLTIKEMACVLALCGYELRFILAPLHPVLDAHTLNASKKRESGA